MRIYPPALAVIFSVAVCGCSESGSSSSNITPPPPQEKEQALFQMQLQSLDKAKGVEGTLQLESQKQSESIDKQAAPPQ